MIVMNRLRRVIFYSLLCLLVTHVLSAEVRRSFSFTDAEISFGFPENTAVRKEYRAVFGGDPMLLRRTKSRVVEVPGEDYRVKVSVAEQNRAVYLLFINERNYSFPLYSKGTYIIKSDEVSGEIIQIKIFIKTEKGSFIRVFPDGDRSRMDVYLYGHPLYRGVFIPVPVTSLTIAPFSKIVAETENIVNWDIIFPEVQDSGYETIISMTETVRRLLPGMPDAEDGAMNRNGEFVFIDTEQPMGNAGFNCSGFAKWLVDGLVYPITENCIDIGSLKLKNVEDRGNRWSQRYESARDPYFGLDWTRNLAAELEKVRHGGKVKSDFADVRNVPFFRYTDDVGFPSEHLQLILYLLAIREPGYFYLASVNERSTASPNLRHHFHVAAIFPHFTPSGKFKAPVFERNFESTIQSFSERYPGGFVHLVRVPGLRTFEPPNIE